MGGSAAGFFAASLLASRGRKVCVLERDEQLEPAPRTLIVTSRVRDLLGGVGDGSITNQIHWFELFTDGKAATIPLAKPDLIIERASLIRALAQQALEAGADVQFGRSFIGLKGTDEGIELNLECRRTGAREQMQAKTVVGADGAGSKVAQAAGWRRQQTVPLVQAIVRLPVGYPPDTVRVWFVPDDTPYFYWLIPESPTRGALGLIGENGRATYRCLEAFLRHRGFEPLSFQGARTPVYTHWVPVERRMGRGLVYLVGDAASQVKVSTVGGIVTGFRGALGVAEAILSGRRSRELRSLRTELDLHLFIRKAVHHFKQDDYSQLVDLLNETTRRALSVHTRDEAIRVLWHLSVRQPRLVLLGLRGLLIRSFASYRSRRAALGKTPPE